MVNLREYRQAAAIFTLMILFFFWPLFRGHIISQADVVYFFPPWTTLKPPDLKAPSNPVLGDQTREFLSFFHVARESVWAGEAPLWNPSIMAGTPLLANSQSALLFPLNWPFYFLPLYLGFTVSSLLKMFIASLATYALGRKISFSHMASILAGTTYTFSIFNVFWLNHPHTNVTIFFPLLLLLAERIKEEPSLSSMVTLGFVVGVQLLGGHVEIAFHVALAVTLFFLFRLLDHPRGRKAFFLRLKMFVGGYILGFCLAAVLMIPFLEFLTQSITWRLRSEGNPFIADPFGLISLLLSDFFVKVSWPFDISVYHGGSLYTGILAVIMATTAFIGRPQKISCFFGFLSLFAFLIVFGVPPFFSLLTSLPLFKQTPNYYMVLLHVMSISILGGMGLDVLLAAQTEDALRARLKRFLMVVSFLLPFLATGLLLAIMKTPFLSPLLRGLETISGQGVGRILSEIGSSLARSLFFMGLAFSLLVISCLTHGMKRFLGTVAICVAFADLFIAGYGWNPAIPIRWAKAPDPPGIQFLKNDQETYRIAGMGHVMPPNLATFCGLQDIRGYDVPVGDRYHTFFEKVLKGKAAWWIYDLPRLEAGSLDFFNLLNVKYFLSVEPLPAPLSLVYDREVKIYKNPNAFPRAFLVHQVERVRDGEAALKRLMDLGPSLREIAVIEGNPPSLPPIPGSPDYGRGKGNIWITKYEKREVEVHVETPLSGLLILSDTYFPGWKAYKDGKRVPIYRTDYLLRGVEIDPGSHRILFVYQPPSFYIGLGLTLLSGVIIAWGLRVKKR